MNANFNTEVERRAEKAENLSFCRGIKLLHIRECVKNLLSLIGRNGIFDEYTLHDMTHIDEMLGIVDWLIPESTKSKMTHAEWLMLTLAVYFHDLGMIVTKKEYQNRNSTTFKEYREKTLRSFDGTNCDALNDNERFLYQEFVRENHAKRIQNWIEGKIDTDLGDANDVIGEVQNMLSNLDNLFKKDLALVCESHHEDDIDDFEKYKTRVLYGNNEEERVNVNYVAIILRIADLLHITRDRTPSISMRVMNVTNPKSVLEWKKQMAVRAVAPQRRRNDEGNIDEALEKNTIEITAYFNGAETAEAYFGLSSYLKYTQSELQKCNAIVTKAKKIEGTVEYDFPWKQIDDRNITTEGFETKKLQFTIDQENILRLLVGHTLYNDSSVVVRELVQNSIDAVRLQMEMERNKVGHPVTAGKITVRWDGESRILSFVDNGTGMTISDIENYLLKVGASKYKEESLKKAYPNFSSISHFGIGILTCFMIADEVDITTFCPGAKGESKEANIVNLRNVNGSYLLRKVNKKDVPREIQKHGTVVDLHVRGNVDMSNLYKDLQKWIVIPEIPVYLSENDNPEVKIGYDSLRDALLKFLQGKGINVDGENYDICEATSGHVTVAYAVKHLKYLSDWAMLTLADIHGTKSRDEYFPIGTCIEGVRVEFATPGYTEASILAIANVKNSKYKTNVARSAIELEGNKEFLSDIYKIYASYLQKQMEDLRQVNFSESWAQKEGYYLMRALLYSSSDRNHPKPVDEELLIQSFARLDCLMMESDGKRTCISAKDAADIGELSIIESKLLEAMQYIFEELPTTASLSSVLDVVCSENSFFENANNVLCNYNPYNIIHKYALRNKEVASIVIDRKQRCICLTLREKAERWKKYESRHYSRFDNIYIQNVEMDIQGLEDEVGVRTYSGIYLKNDTELSRYLDRTIDALSKEKNGKYLVELFLWYVFHTNVLEAVPQTVDSNELRRHVPRAFDEDAFAMLWEALDIEEFTDVILKKTHLLYSIRNWSRDPSESVDIDEFYG